VTSRDVMAGSTRALWPSFALAGVVLGAVTLTAVLREAALSRDEMAAAEGAASQSAWEEAIGHTRAAAEAATPGSAGAEQALQRLAGMGRDAAVRGDRKVALLAYGAMRTVALATRAPGVSNVTWQSVAENGLGQLATSGPGVAPARSAERSSAMHADLGTPSLPATWVLATLSLAALAILAGLSSIATWVRPSSGAFIGKLVLVLGFSIYATVLLLS
jgi:hypothetical protein